MKLFINLCFLVLFFGTISANAGEIITVDNRDSSVSQTGWWSTSGGQNPNASDSVYSFGASTFTWEVEVTESSAYDIEVYWTSWANRTSEAKYEVFDPQDSLVAEGTFDQKQNGSTWVSLGSENLQPGSYSVTLSSAASGSISADAVRFVQDDSVTTEELVTEVDYFSTDGVNRFAQVQKYYTGEVFVFYGFTRMQEGQYLDQYEASQDFKAIQLREHDTLASILDRVDSVPPSPERFTEYDSIYHVNSLNVVKNDNQQLLVSWIEAAGSDGLGSNRVVAQRINLLDGSVVEKRVHGSLQYDPSETIISVTFSPDGSSAEFLTTFANSSYIGAVNFDEVD